MLPTPPEMALPVKVFPAICKQQNFMFCHHQLQGSRVDPCVMPSIAHRNQLWRQWVHESCTGQMISWEAYHLVGANLSSIGLIIGSNALFTIGACCVACDGVAAAMILCYANSLVVGTLHKGQDHCKGANMVQTLLGCCHYRWCVTVHTIWGICIQSCCMLFKSRSVVDFNEPPVLHSMCTHVGKHSTHIQQFSNQWHLGKTSICKAKEVESWPYTQTWCCQHNCCFDRQTQSHGPYNLRPAVVSKKMQTR